MSAAPDGLSVTAGDGVLTLSWNAISHSGDTYRVYWGTDPSFTTNYSYTEETSTSLAVTVVNGTKYYFRVAGWIAGSQTATTDWSNTVSGILEVSSQPVVSSSSSVPVAASVTPKSAAPVGLSVTANVGNLTLAWNASTHSGDTYVVNLSTDNFQVDSLLYPTTETDGTSVGFGFPNGTIHYFRVAGWDSKSDTLTTDWSITVSGTPVASSTSGDSSSSSQPSTSQPSTLSGDSSSSAPSGPALPVCISGADKDSALAGYDEQIKLHEKDADLKWYNELLNGRNNVAGREICTGTEVSKVVIVAVQATVDQPPAQASVPAAVLTVEKPVVLLKEVVTEVVVASTEVQELVAVAGFVEGTVEVQVENAEGLSDWLVIDPASSNTVALGDGAKSIKYRVTSKDKSQPVVEKIVEIARLSVLTEVKGVVAEVEAASADQLALNPTVEVEKSSGSKTVIWVAVFIMLLIAVMVFGMQKKKKDDANSNTVA